MQLFIDNLTHIDFSYLDAARGLVGESWQVDLLLQGGLDEQGMICDFALAKPRIKQWLDQWVDHVLLLPRALPNLELKQTPERLQLQWPHPRGGLLQLNAPRAAVTLLPLATLTPEALADWCNPQLSQLFPGAQVQLTLRPEAHNQAFYHYSHGLKQHQGNCQRIAHGHRSRIEIHSAQGRDPGLEQQWAQQWQDIYLGNRQDLQATLQLHGLPHHHYTYESSQGLFELLLPAACCDLLDTETTVENIAQHIAQRLAASQQLEHGHVKAYEGIGKGAIAYIGD